MSVIPEAKLKGLSFVCCNTFDHIAFAEAWMTKPNHSLSMSNQIWPESRQGAICRKAGFLCGQGQYPQIKAESVTSFAASDWEHHSPAPELTIWQGQWKNIVSPKITLFTHLTGPVYFICPVTWSENVCKHIHIYIHTALCSTCRFVFKGSLFYIQFLIYMCM